jgi:RNA polymerase sigma-70 factor (ECF subfamily)
VHRPVDTQQSGDGQRQSQIAQARGGSDAALGTILESCRDYLLLVANEEVPDELRRKIAPSDLVQQTFLEATRGFGHFAGQSDGELLAWLRQILTKNVRDAIRHFRHRAKRNIALELSLNQADIMGEAAGRLVDGGPSPSWRAVLGEDCRRLVAAMDRLPGHYRHVIRMRNFESQRFAEIGQSLGLSADSTRKLWARAMARLIGEMKSQQSKP